MPDVSAVIRDTVPITHFNRGLAGKIFEEVRQSGAKVVIKNNSPECVLLSPEVYLSIMDEIKTIRAQTDAVINAAQEPADERAVCAPDNK